MKYARLTGLFLMFFFFVSNLQAEKFCTQTQVFFDTDEDEPLPQSQEQLARLVADLGDRDYLIEITGHTDSDAEDAYNIDLSLRRARHVRAYLEAFGQGSYSFRMYHHGEAQPARPNHTEAGKAYNRRVELALVPMQGDKLVFANGAGASASASVSLFGDCPICQDPPKLTYWPTADAATAAGVGMMSSGGDSLITSGMLNLESTCAAANAVGEVVYRYPAELYDPNMVAWELNDDSSAWDRIDNRLVYDSINRVYIMWGNGLGGRAKNVDCGKVRDVKTYYKYPDLLPKHMRLAYTLADSAAGKRDTFDFHPGDTLEGIMRLLLWCTYFDDQRVYRPLPVAALDTFTTFSPQYCVLKKYLIVDQSKIQVCPLIPPTDTTLIVKLRGYERGVQPNLYFNDLGVSMTLDQKRRRKFTSVFPDYPHGFVVPQGEDAHRFPYQKVKTRYRKRKKRLKVKIKKKWLRK